MYAHNVLVFSPIPFTYKCTHTITKGLTICNEVYFERYFFHPET